MDCFYLICFCFSALKRGRGVGEWGEVQIRGNCEESGNAANIWLALLWLGHTWVSSIMHNVQYFIGLSTFMGN